MMEMVVELRRTGSTAVTVKEMCTRENRRGKEKRWEDRAGEGSVGCKRIG